jgi:hypothetical protein
MLFVEAKKSFITLTFKIVNGSADISKSNTSQFSVKIFENLETSIKYLNFVNVKNMAI